MKASVSFSLMQTHSYCETNIKNEIVWNENENEIEWNYEHDSIFVVQCTLTDKWK